MSVLVYNLTPGDNLAFQSLNGCAVYSSGYGVSGSVNSGELGGWTTPDGKQYLSIGTFSSSYVTNRSASFTLNTQYMEYFVITVIAGSDQNGGERPNNPGESLYLQSPSGQVRTLARSGKDAGLTYPNTEHDSWTPLTFYLSSNEKLASGTWTIYAFSVNTTEFDSSGSVYDSNANANDRYGVSSIKIYGDPPTTIRYFRINGESTTAEINIGDSITFSWDTTLNGNATASSTSIDQSIGNVTPVNAGTLSIAGPSEDTTYTLTVVGNTGTLTESVDVKIIKPDDIPDLFTFPSVTGAEISTAYTTDSVNISGLATGISPTVSATNGAETSVNGGTFSTTNKTITNGQSLRVRMTSSSSYDTSKTTSVTVGSIDTAWTITTKSPPSQVPNPFSFTNVIDAPLQTYTYSDKITITGITQSVTVTAPNNSTYTQTSVNNGTWSSTAKTISNGQTLQLRIMTSNVLGDIRSTSIAVGDSAQVSWQVTNVLVADSSPDYFDFGTKTNQQPSTAVNSNSVTITGINVPTTVTTTNSALISVNGGTYNASPVTINNNDNVLIQLVSSSTPGGEVDTEVTIGSLSNTFKVITTTSGDKIPDNFYFYDKNNQPPNTYIYSNKILLSGITSPSTLTVTGGEASINNGSWATTHTVNDGDSVIIRQLSSSTLGATVTASISVG